MFLGNATPPKIRMNIIWEADEEEEMIYRFIDFLLPSERKKPSCTFMSNVMKILKSARTSAHSVCVCVCIGNLEKSTCFSRDFIVVEFKRAVTHIVVSCLGDWRFLRFFPFFSRTIREIVSLKVALLCCFLKCFVVDIISHSAPTWKKKVSRTHRINNGSPTS